MKILITGASGFIGSFIVEQALSEGFEVWAGIRSGSSREYLQDHRIRFIDLYFSDKTKLKEQLSEVRDHCGKWDFVVHNAGVTKCRDRRDFDRVNFRFTETLTEALMECDMIPDKFILMSSLSIFGPVKENSDVPIQSTDVPHPNTAYGESKLKAETHLQSLSGFPYVILRPTGVYGPRDKDYFLMIKSVRQGFDFAVGRKPQYITFIYVKDLVKVIFLIIRNENIIRKAYFISDGNVYTGKDYSLLVQKALNKKRVIRLTLPLCFVKTISVVTEKIVGIFGKTSTLNKDKYHIIKQRNWRCDISELQRDTAFKADYDLAKGVKESIDWYKKNRWI
ncbi:MAG: NAD(P)-dependent oxidoreductase [Candidatus Azobacteroides sp.]|nr:NAD(P)-dependent oxidoreductase [Candidatus Azobacteroides sp.]